MPLVNTLPGQDLALSAALLDLFPKAVLVLVVGQTPLDSFQVVQANARAYDLINGLPKPLLGTTLDQLPPPFNDPYLLSQLRQALNQLTQVQFQLAPPVSIPGATPVAGYTCQGQPVDAGRLVLSLEPIPSPSDLKPWLEQVIETLPFGLILFRAIRDEQQVLVDFQALLCNQAGADISRQPKEIILTQPISQRYPDRQAYELFHRYIAVVESGQPHHQRLYLPPQAIWLDVTVTRYEDGLLVCFQDVTLGQKTAALLESVMSSSPAAVRYYESVRDPAGRIIDFITSTGNELAEYRPYRPFESTTGKRLLDLYPYLRGNGLFERYVAVVESGQSDQFETSLLLNQHRAWFDCRAVRHGDGFVLTTLDSTFRKESELATQQQAHLLKGVLDSSTSSILVLRPLLDQAGVAVDFQITLANPATRGLFGPILGQDYTLEAMMSQTLLGLSPAVSQRAVFTALQAVVHSGQSIHESVDYPQLDLTYTYALTPFQEGVLMITTDITPLRRYQQQLEASNGALNRSNEYLQQFASIASHDLQEPLRKIQAFSDLLLAQYGPGLDPEAQDLLRRQQQAAQRMQTLVKDLLAYARLTTPSASAKLVSLAVIAQEVLDDLDTLIQETNAQVHLQALPSIPGHKTQLRQLVQNLLTNALKFTKPGQPPRVHIEALTLRADQLPPFGLSAPAARWIALRVSDEGIGFETAQGERIFDLFHRLHGRSQYTGTGIGLAVVKKVVENHQGFITAHSQPGAGATFTVYLPLV